MRSIVGDVVKSVLFSRRSLLLGAAASLAGPGLALGAANPWAVAAEINRTVRPPRFPLRAFDILAEGAVVHDVDLNSAAFARAIQKCADAGGGRVVVPPGRWIT